VHPKGYSSFVSIPLDEEDCGFIRCGVEAFLLFSVFYSERAGNDER
jgi:hypothetical protein